MMKRILPLLLAALFCITVAAPIAAYAEDSVPTKAQAVSGVSFRDQPSTSGNLLRYLKTGEIVTVIGQPNPYWYNIQDQQGVTGYVSSSSKYIKVISNAKIIYGVNFRTAPSSTADRIRLLSTGEDMLILAKVNDSWYKAQDSKGVVGYVSSSTKYITVNNDIYKMDLPVDERIESFINQGMTYMGTPYEFGSDRFDTSTFDCSDFVQQSFWDITREVIAGDSRGQADYVKSLGPVASDWRNLKRGDLMFFMSYKGYKASDYAGIDESTETVTHVAIYLGNGQMLQTYSPESGGVRIDTIGGNTWEYRYLYGGTFTK
ncbi:C40 family peptidase [Gorillibacterium sp. sgz5001074]|uniref:C40 family peptidase n=1 Tax=Gorillibacterium sp. sgz5001074 TaxID=3446695 RepID=UPI003F661529